MIDVSRRRVLLLVSLATAWLLGGIRPSCAGWLERWFSRGTSTLTSSITPNEGFYLTSYRSPPTVRIQEWSLSVRGLVERPMTLTYEQLCARPSVSQVVTLECVGNTVAGEYIGTALWEGCSLPLLLEEAGVKADAVDVVFRAADEYSDSISLIRAMAGDVMIAFKMNGVALPQSHGFPARTIVPGHYGMKSVQWLTDIEVVDHNYKGYYAKKGWTDEATIKTMSRIDVPGHGSTLTGLRHTVAGLAFAGTRGISAVEIRTDEGASWTKATLEVPVSTASWVFWHFEWIVPQAGSYTLAVRATDGTGALQSSTEQDAAPDGASGIHEITVTIEG
jgi:DMSO/TMAO reductase YedYZ molybdopterin-dependent catalytic subunit